MKSVLAASFALCATVACGGPAGAHERIDAAIAAFAAFQQALQRGAVDDCRAVLTEESQPVAGQIDWATVRRRPPIVVRGGELAGHAVYVQGSDPTTGAEATFVVVKENGAFKVDLVATAAFYAKDQGPVRYDFEPGQLSPQDHDRLHRKLLAQPPR